MYREPALPASSELAPTELVYPAVQRDAYSRPAPAVFQVALVSAIVGAVVSVTTTAYSGLAALVAIATLSAWRFRRAKSALWVVLRIEGDAVIVKGFRDKQAKGRFRLGDLDVTLDTKTIRSIQDGRSAIPAVRFMESKAGPEHDIARIVFSDGTGGSAPLTEAYVAHMDAIEWFGKIRVFLRKNGWLPEDERAERDEPAR